MQLVKADKWYLILIFIISGILVADLFLNIGRLASFDAPFHITNMAQFYQAAKSGDFPVVWNDGEGNYGLPMGIVSHQVTSYLGALIIAIGATPVLAYSIVFFIGILLSNIVFYLFLRIYFKQQASFLATFLFNFTYYKILNVYVRGALPEVFSNMFLATILISLYLFIEKKKQYGLFILIFSVALLALNHPMMLLIYAFVFVPYALFLIFKQNGSYAFRNFFLPKNLLILFAISFAGILGIGIAGYYLIPLIFEIKYFYFGLTKNHLTPNTYMSIINFIDPSWKYFTSQEIFPRGHLVRTGLLEFIALCGGLFYTVQKIIQRKVKDISNITGFTAIVSLIIIFMMSPAATPLFEHISLLSNIQFQWRMLSAFIFLPPILYAVFFTKFNNKIFMILFLLIISLTTFPQLYGKNYTRIPQDIYFFTTQNVHDVMMNTIWTGKTEDYPVNRQKVGIISGEGRVEKALIKNSSRQYVVMAYTPLRMVDYTFYFPGWNVYIDGKPTNIEYQDPQYRGVITYNLPVGSHSILIKFEDTKVRSLGKIVSLICIFFVGALFIFRKRIKILA